MKILVFGPTGMLGSAIIKVLSEKIGWQVFGTARSERAKGLFNSDIASNLILNIDVENHDSLVMAFNQAHPDVVINCIGLVKQLANSEDSLQAIPINSILPHRLARLCNLTGARFIHLSTDCVFNGDRGNYSEMDPSDARDLYGKSKYLGEVDYPNAITLRTSSIGHELQSKHGLVDWFLSQHGRCKGYTKAIFSGLPTVVLAQIIRDIVIPRRDLSGLFHVASNPISKYELLKLIATIYGKTIEIIPDSELAIDRSLDAELFKTATGYVAPEWVELIKTMHRFN